MKQPTIEYYREEVEKYKEEHKDISQVNMLGMLKTLSKLKRIIGDNLTEVSYMTYDIGYHGWCGEAASNMGKIEKLIMDKLLEIYAICEIALGGYIDETEN